MRVIERIARAVFGLAAPAPCVCREHLERDPSWECPRHVFVVHEEIRTLSDGIMVSVHHPFTNACKEGWCLAAFTDEDIRHHDERIRNAAIA